MNLRWVLFSVALALGGLGSACGDDTAGDGDGTEGGSGDETGDDDDGEGSGDDGTADSAACEEAPVVTCPEPVDVACEGPQTAVALPDPDVACDGWSVSSDAPAAYPVGQTAVTYTLDADGASDACTTTVTVSDDVGPDLVCPPMEVLVRTDPDLPLAPPPAIATDVCSEPVDVAFSPAELGPGSTQVTYTATDAAGNESSCDIEFAVAEVYAASGFQIMGATLLGSGETEVTFGWEPAQADFHSGYRFESGPAADGPWTEVASLDEADQLYTTTLTDDAAYYRLVTTSGAGDGGVTPAVAGYRIADELYDIRDVPVPGVPFATTLYGVLRHPVALGEGPFPLVVLMHGNHGNCRNAPDDPNDYCSTSDDHDCSFAGAFTTPNAEGLAYLAETLAAQGYLAVSVSGNAMNCRDDYIIERSQLLGEHLRYWSDWNAGQGELGPLVADSVDLSRVGLLGHSRGGDAVSNLPGVLEANPIPGVAVRSVFALAPTDFHQVVVRDTNLAVLLPSCDGDVFNLIGMNHYDRSSAFEDGVHHSQLFFIGANHNFFNTQWRISDWTFQPFDAACLPDDSFLQQVQQNSLRAAVGPWFAQTLQDAAPIAYQRADATTPTVYDQWAGDDLDWRWSYSATDRIVIDGFSGANAPGTNELGGTNVFDDWLVVDHCIGNSCDPSYLHEHWGMRLLYDETNAVPRAALELAGLDVSAAEALSFRVVSRLSTLNVGLDTQEFTIRITDTDGASAELLLSELKTVQHLYGQNVSREVLETVRVPIGAIESANPVIDVAALDLLELEMTSMPTGSVIVTDFEVANASD